MEASELAREAKMNFSLPAASVKVEFVGRLMPSFETFSVYHG